METMEYTYDDNTVSDLHKDAFGFRPSSAFFQWWAVATPAEKQEEWDSLLKSLEATIARENEMEKEAIARFEVAITRVIGAGAGDRATAIQWLKGAEEFPEMHFNDESYFEWSQGIPYGYIKKTAGV